MISRITSSLCFIVALGSYTGCNYVTDLQQATLPAQPAPIPATPAPIVVTPLADPVEPTPEPPAKPKLDADVLARWQAGHRELQQVCKTIDDLAYGRRGNLNQQQTENVFIECNQRLMNVVEVTPQLTPAAEALKSVMFYANPLNAKVSKDQRLSGYQIGSR